MANTDIKTFLDEEGLNAYHSGNITKINESIESHNSSSTSHSDMRSEITEIKESLNDKANSTHNHDEFYYTETEVDSLIDNTKTYVDSKVSDLTTTSTVNNKITAHNTNETAHSDIRALIDGLSAQLEQFLDVDDTTVDQLSEVLTLIENNKGTLESLTTTKINVSDIVDNLTTSSATKVLSAKQGVAIKELIDALQAEVDTNLATQTSHINNKSNPHEVTLSQLGVTATSGELNYVSGVTSSIQTQLNSKSATGHKHAISDVTDLQETLDSKQENITGAATTIAGANLTVNRALLSDANGKVAVSAVTSTELGYLDGVTSNLQTQLNQKLKFASTGTVGQFAISDGNGGITWLTVKNGNEVAY